jgi:predicted DNA-binding transcriptional regulator AlpA
MSEHLAELRRQYPGQLVLNPVQIAKVLGSARQTIYNQVSKKEFPIRPIYRGRSWGCSIVEIARYLDTGAPQITFEIEKPKRGRKPSPRPVLKLLVTLDDEVGGDSAVLERRPSSRQVSKYHEFWDDVLESMGLGRTNLGTAVIRNPAPREIT